MDNEIEKIIGRNIRRLREGCGLTRKCFPQDFRSRDAI